MNQDFSVPEIEIYEQSNSPVITKKMVQIIKQSSPWMRFLSICGFFSGALILLSSLVVLLFSILSDELPFVQGLGISLVYLVPAGFYLIISISLWKAAGAAADVYKSPDTASFEKMLDLNRSFWKTLGIFSIVGICLGIVVFLVVILGALVAGLSHV